MQLNPSASNPFVGLRPFESTESLLFFGRSSQTGELLERLHFNRFVSVVGRSGCGKSSLIRAGLIPKLQAGFLLADRDRWIASTMKPGDRPLRNLATAVLEKTAAEPSLREINKLVEAISARGVEVLIDNLKPLLDGTDSNFLLLVDQFEEIFRFGSHGRYDQDETDDASLKSRDEAADFVAMMLALAEQREVPVYVVMTMRSDFLGDCDTFYGLPEAMNRSQYLVPRLSTQQREDAISGPIRLYGQKITPGLLDLVRNDVGDKLDQLPVMQHAMMRTWDNWNLREAGPIDVPHYRAAGTIKNALSEDAETVLRGLNQHQRQVAMQMFQALTDTDSEGRRIRRPAHLQKLEAITGASRKEIMDIVDAFQTGGRSFLTVSPDKLGGNDLIDISHESLIRQWHTLRDWVDQEAEDRSTYLRIAQAAVLYQKRKGGLWDDPDLHNALDWWEKRQPSRAWAEQYHPTPKVVKTSPQPANPKSSAAPGDEKEIDMYTGAEDFLEDSRRKRDKEIADNEKQRQRELRRTRGFALVILGAFLLTSAFAAYAVQQKGVALYHASLAKQKEAEANTAKAGALEREKQERVAKERLQESESARFIALRTAEANAQKAETAKNEALKQEGIAKENAKKATESALVANQQKERAESLIYTSDMKLVQYGEEEGDSARSRRRLEKYLPSNLKPGPARNPSRGKEPERRAYEWFYFWRLNHRDARTLAGTGGVSSLSFSPDHKMLATAYENGSVKLWKAASGQEIATVKLEFSPSSVAFSTDGRSLAIGGDDKKVYLWDTAAGGEPVLFGELLDSVQDVAFSPDGKTLAAASEDEVRMWDVATRSELPKFVRKVEDTKPKNEKSEDSFFDETSSIGTMAFSPDGKHLAVTRGGVVELWDMTSDPKQNPITLIVEESAFIPVLSVAFSPDGRTLAASDSDGSVVFFDLEFKRKVATFKAHKDEFVTSMAFSPDGKTIVTGGSDATAKLWDAQLQDRLITLPNAGPVMSVMFSKDGKTLATGGEDGAVKVWDTALLKDYLEPAGFGEELVTKAYSPDVRRVSSGGKIMSVAYSPDDRILAALSQDGLIKLLKTDRGNKQATDPYSSMGEIARHAEEAQFSSFAFSPDSKQLAAGDRAGGVVLYDTTTWKEIPGPTNRLVPRNRSAITSLVFSPKGTILAVSTGDLVILWHVGTQQTSEFKGRAPIAFSQDGELVAAANEDETVRLWDVGRKREIGATGPNLGDVKSLAFSPNHKILAVGSNNEDVRLWDVPSLKRSRGVEPVLLEGHRGKGVYCLAFSPDGRTIASGGQDNTVKLWSAITHRELATFKAHKKPVLSLAFSPDGRSLATASSDASLKIWRAATDEEVWAQCECGPPLP